MSENKNPKLDKSQIFARAILFTVVKSAVKRTLNATTSKTDRIIYNSLEKAIAKHAAEKQEEL